MKKVIISLLALVACNVNPIMAGASPGTSPIQNAHLKCFDPGGDLIYESKADDITTTPVGFKFRNDKGWRTEIFVGGGTCIATYH